MGILVCIAVTGKVPAVVVRDHFRKAQAEKVVEEAIQKKADASFSGQLNFQTPATEIMEKIVDLHHDLMFFIIVIVVFVS